MPIVTMRARLTDNDIRTLIKGPSEEARAHAAHKVCRCIEDTGLSAEERAHAEQIMAVMAQDGAVLVRRALAVVLKSSRKLPRDIALSLSRDVESVALLVLQNSPSLTDADLIEIVRACPPIRQLAVASRERLSTAVTGAIAAFAPLEAVERALANDRAEFDEKGLEIVLGRFAGADTILRAMVHRRELSAAVTEKLLPGATGDVFDHLVNNHELPPKLAVELATGGGVAVDIVEQAGRQADLTGFAAQLSQRGLLTPSLLMRALCVGHMEFVEHAMAEMAGIPHPRMWLLLHDCGHLGVKAAFERAGLPGGLFAPFRAAVEVYHCIEREGAARDRATFRKLMLERSLTLFQSGPREDLDYLLGKLEACGEPAGRAS